jgi:hypothetical protein
MAGYILRSAETSGALQNTKVQMKEVNRNTHELSKETKKAANFSRVDA